MLFKLSYMYNRKNKNSFCGYIFITSNQRKELSLHSNKQKLCKDFIYGKIYHTAYRPAERDDPLSAVGISYCRHVTRVCTTSHICRQAIGQQFPFGTLGCAVRSAVTALLLRSNPHSHITVP